MQRQLIPNQKGQLIWIYANKDTDYKCLERIQTLINNISEKPIVFMLLNDADNHLARILTDYDVLDHMNQNIRTAYSNIFLKDQEKVEENLQKAFENLKKNREQITSDGFVKWKKRLPIALTEIFESLYPDNVTFNFDALLTNSNNFTGKGIAYYCQILKMLLSNKVNFDTIHDFPVEIRNRISAILMTENAHSWKCVTKECNIVTPSNPKAKAIYDQVAEILEDEEEYSCENFFETYCYPPYGLSQEAALLFLAVIILNQWYNVRIQYDDDQTTVNLWKDKVIINDKKLSWDVVRNTTLLWVDTGSLEAKLQQLFKKIDANRDMETATILQEQLDNTIKFYGLPESQEIYYRVAKSKYEQFQVAQRVWKNSIDHAQDTLDQAESRRNVVKALDGFDEIGAISIFNIFYSRGIDVPDAYQAEIDKLNKRADDIIKLSFREWLDNSFYCQSVNNMNGFEKFGTQTIRRLSMAGYFDYASLVQTKMDKELRNQKDIKSRQELVDDGKKFLKKYAGLSTNNYILIKELIVEGNELIPRFSRFGVGLGKEAIKLSQQVEKAINSLKEKKQSIDDDMASIWDSVFNAETVEDIRLVVDCIDTLARYNIPDKDFIDFKNLKLSLTEFLADTDSIIELVNDRKALEEKIMEQLKKYGSEEFDYDFMTILNDAISSARSAIDVKDNVWRRKNLTLGDKSRKAVYEWKERMTILPAYLSDATLKLIEQLDAEADMIISEGKIEDVVHFFEKLNTEEKKKCFNVLQNYMN